MKRTTLLPVAALVMSSFAQAGFIELGFEMEDHNSAHSSSDMFMPYLAAGIQPFADTPLHVQFKFSDKQASEQSGAEGNTYSNDRGRQEYIVFYHYQVNDQFTFSPRLNIRHNEYSHNDTRDTEWRIYPNMTYKLNDTFSLALDGFIAPVTAKDEYRGVEKEPRSGADRHSYNDYKHELDFRLNMTFNESQSARISFYNEQSKAKGVEHTNAQETMDEWQLRMIYTHNFDRLSISPFARINLHREFENGMGETKKEARNRFGVFGAYQMNNDFDLVYEVYHQNEERKGWDNVQNATDRDRMFYKLAVKYSF
ncbi:hypothetical protein [Thaumasiovibrio subtropicus]|uniref:hypothetical protein n=1 Tax=Thaumasiovibrio subtropicus TaxID=1891207 RepID=UPI000B357759|nr:hypothetical protein [Thaumasiovibrio subtropicus]